MANQKSGVFTPNGKSEQRGCRKFDINDFEKNRLLPALHEFVERRKAMGMRDKRLWKILCEEFGDKDITKLVIDYDRYMVLEGKSRNCEFIKNYARAVVKILSQFCESTGIENIKELCTLYSAEELANKVYGIGVIKLQAFCIYCVILDVPFYLSEEDRINGKLYEYKKPTVKRTRKTTTKKEGDK